MTRAISARRTLPRCDPGAFGEFMHAERGHAAASYGPLEQPYIPNVGMTRITGMSLADWLSRCTCNAEL